MATSLATPPIFVLGVPRSGTTLLRTVLDSHSAIACGPETPWLGGHQPRSVMEVWRFLREDKHGFAASYGMPPSLVSTAAAGFVDQLLGEYARSKGKKRWAEKTPDNALYVDFLLELFPEAKFIHLVRDGLDVAMSTSVVELHRKGISEFLERNLGLGPGVPAVENTPFTTLLRWRHWNTLIERSLSERPHLRISYERLVMEPEVAVRAITDFIGEPFEPAMLNYERFGHDYPEWEWGSADVRAKDGITGTRVGRGRRELSETQLSILEPLSRSKHTPRSEGALPAGSAKQLSDYLAGFARPLGFATDASSLKAAVEAWPALVSLDSPSAHVAFSGSPNSALPWIAAMLGASVRVLDARPSDSARTQLRDRLRLPLEWAHPGTPGPTGEIEIHLGGAPAHAGSHA